MSFNFQFNRFICKLVRNVRLDISGEINILETIPNKAIMVDDSLYSSVLNSVVLLQKSYPYLDLSVSRELHEITIKFFAIDKLVIYPVNYFEDFQSDISEMIGKIVTTSFLKVRINFFGNLKTWKKIEKFILVNNDRDIYFKITECIPRNVFSIFIGEKVDSFLNK